jgi:hypothetical protein
MNNEELLNRIQELKVKRDTVTEMYDAQITLLTSDLSRELGEGNGLKTDMAIAYWQNNTKVEVEDWNALMEYVAKNNAFDVLQRRVSPAQLEARIKAGAKITGVSFAKSKTLIIKGVKDK